MSEMHTTPTRRLLTAALAIGLAPVALSACTAQQAVPATSPAVSQTAPAGSTTQTDGGTTAPGQTAAGPSSTQQPSTQTPEATSTPELTVPATSPSTQVSRTTPSASASASQGAATSRGKTDAIMGDNTLTLGYVTVTTGDGPSTKPITNISGNYVKVCVTALPPGYEKGLPVSAAVWTLTTTPKTTTFPRVARGHVPAFKPATLQVGQCTEGYLNFDTSKAPAQGTVDAYVLHYDASFGDHGTWSYD